MADADEDALLAAMTARTRLIALSHVLWTTGRRLDLARLRRPDGPPLLVDGAQSAGAIPVDLAGADFYTVSAQKWLCGPDPSGALFVRDPERLRAALPSMFSQQSHEPDGAFVPKDGARRFDSYCDTMRTNTGRAIWYSVRRRGMRVHSVRSPSLRRVKLELTYVALTRSRSLGRRSSDAL